MVEFAFFKSATIYSFTGALKTLFFLLFRQFSSQNKVIKEDTESISRVLHKLSVPYGND